MPSEDRLALVVGCGSYDDPSLEALQATLTDVGAIEAVLKDERICRFSSCKAIVDQSKAVVEREVHRFLKAAPFDSLVLLYFTGHGIKDENGALYFAQKDTESELLESTAVSADFIRRQMDACTSGRKVLLLDCCFAGAFPRGSKAGRGAVDIEGQFAGEIRRGRGFFVISATGEFQYAYSSAGTHVEPISGAPQPSVFTRHLVHGLQTGEADTDDNGLIKVGELFDYLQKKVGAERPGQTPKMAADVEEDFVLALVPAKQGPDLVLPLEIEPAEAQAGVSLEPTLPDGSKAIVSVPAGSAEGSRIVLPGLGEPGSHGGKPGDLVFEIKFATKQPVAGENLFAKVALSAEEAEDGCVAAVRYASGVISLEVPPGTGDGDVFTVAGRGLPGRHGGSAGSLVVTVEVAPGIPEKGKDYVYELTLSPEEAAAGCAKTIDTPSGESFTVEIAAGTTDGSELPAKLGLGYPGRFGGQAGNLLVHVKIAYPAPEDLYYDLSLTAREAEEGTVKTITGSWGKFEYAVPPNSQDGRTVRVKGMGAPGAPGRPSGDLVVRYVVQPEPKLPEEVPVEPAAESKPAAEDALGRLTMDLADARIALAEIERDFKSGKVTSVGAGMAMLVFVPIAIYLLYKLILWVIHQSFVPQSITDFLDPLLPVVGWIAGVALTIGAIAVLVEGLGHASRRSSLKAKVRRLESDIATQVATKP
ncbi:MAG TPA: DnaJ C-terminal domain-containing protein [Fimbriimonadaceae bacterium]|nr:DnaJ C-terminal domain-containing protein [Fimbriimonadaceae bacterium]